MKLFLFFIICNICFVTCSNKQQVFYSGKITIDSVKHLNSEVLNDEFLFSAMSGGMFVEDSLIIIVDSHSQQKFVHFFNKNTGQHISSIGPNGQGPGELLDPISLWIDRTEKKLKVYSYNLRKIVEYDFDQILNENPNFEEKYINNPDGFYISDITSSNNDTYVRGIDERLRFGCIKKDKIEMMNNSFPILVNHSEISDIEESRAVMSYGDSWKISPNGEKMVQATYIGGVIELFNVSDEVISPYKLLTLLEPKYKIVKGVTPTGVSWTEETQFGFEDAFVTDDLIYLLTNGGKAKDGAFFAKTIIVLDWEGDFLYKYELDKSLNKFVVDESTKTIYGFTLMPNENPILVKFSY